jgi:hypothetical protein
MSVSMNRLCRHIAMGVVLVGAMPLRAGEPAPVAASALPSTAAPPAISSPITSSPTATPVSAPTPASIRAGLEATAKAALPAAPAGFHWEIYRNIGFLQPAGWQLTRMSAVSAGMSIGSIASAPENFSGRQVQDPGFSVQITSGTFRVRAQAATVVARALFQSLQAAHPDSVLQREQITQSGASTVTYRYRDTSPAGEPLIVHKRISASDTLDCIHIFTFQSPATSWDDNWKKTGAFMVEKATVIPGLPSD